MMRFLVAWLINAAALAVAAWLFDGIAVAGAPTLAVVALIFGLVNALVRPLLKLLTCPLILLTLGLFILVVNAVMLMLTSWLAGILGLGFTVQGFWTALGGALVVSLVSFALTVILGTEEERERRRRRRSR